MTAGSFERASDNHNMKPRIALGPIASIFLCAFFLFAPVITQAQHDETDTSAVYRKLHRYAQRYKVTRWVYEGIFVEPVEGEVEAKPVVGKKVRVDPYRKYKGKVIRRIEMTVNDPFGYSVDDTVSRPVSGIQRMGNRLHRRTRPWVLRGLLLMKVHDRLDPLELSESERLLRTSPAVNDARIAVHPVQGSKDSVDVLVYVLDKWTIDADGDISTTDAEVQLRDRNFLGYGQEIEQITRFTLGSDQPELNGRYGVYNIARSYIGTSVSYFTSPAQDQVSGQVSRSFYSPLTKWAGAVAGSRSWVHNSIVDSTGAEVALPRVGPVALDTWLGRSFRLDPDTSNASRVSHIIVGARYASTHFAMRPSFDTDTLRVNRNTNLYLVGAGLSVQQFYKERYLFRFGFTEDVPEGFLARVNLGIRKREFERSEPYIGAEITRGRHYPAFGYFTATLACGTFFNAGRTVDGAFRLDADYFTNALAIGRWQLRQFVRLSSTIGVGRPRDQALTLNGEQLYGFASEEVAGTRKTVLGFRTVLYLPYSFLGFRFAPVAMIGFGTVDHEHDAWFGSRIYTAFALGLMVRNEYLLVKTFQLSIGFYPHVPGEGNATTLFNPVTSFDLGVRNYAYTQPDVVGYY